MLVCASVCLSIVPMSAGLDARTTDICVGENPRVCVLVIDDPNMTCVRVTVDDEAIDIVCIF